MTSLGSAKAGTWFDTVLRATQYLGGLSPAQDVWPEAAGTLTGMFGADLVVAEAHDQHGGAGPSLLVRRVRGRSPAPDAVEDELAGYTRAVLGTGFLERWSTAGPVAWQMVTLPVPRQSGSATVLTIGHAGAEPLPERLLEIYLALAGVVGAVADRAEQHAQLTHEGRILEQLVDKRTAELTSTLDRLGRQVVERRAAEQQMRMNNRELRRLNQELEVQNAQLEQFVYTASHDLQSPLVTILGFLGHARQCVEQGRNEQGMELLDRVEVAARRMRTNVNELLELSRVGRADPEPQAVDLASLARELADELGPQAEAVGAQIVVEPDMPVISGTASRLRQALENLVTNALKYACPEPGAVVRIGAVRRDPEVRLFVADTGPGVPQDQAQRVFGLFQRLSRDKELPGTGVGLALVKRVAELHRGRAWVEPGPDGRGAVFWLTLALTGVEGQDDNRVG